MDYGYGDGGDRFRLPRIPAMFVTGVGSVLAEPDRAGFTAGVSSFAKKLPAAQAEAIRTMNAVIAAMDGLGIERKDRRTTAHRVNVRYEYDDNRTPIRIAGYQVDASVHLTIRDLTIAGRALEAAVNAGANNVGQLNLWVHDPAAPAKAARELAVKDAAEKARQLAVAAGLDLGRVLRFVETSSPHVAPRERSGHRFYEMAAPMKLPTAAAIETGQDEIQVTIAMVWEIVAAR